MWVKRAIEQSIVDSADSRPAVLLTGARQTGKSSLLQRLFKNSPYVSFDRFLLAQEAESNPDIFLSKFDTVSQVVLDEVQYAPSLFRELKIRIDTNRKQYGKWLLTGSQKFQLMQNVSESLAGRIRILHLETLSAEELRKSNLFSLDELKTFLLKGGYPELWKNNKLNASDFFSDYIQTYLEKDLKQIINVKNLFDFQRFLLICASRIGQLINFADLSKDLGISIAVIKQWLHALEVGGIIYLLPPYYNNFGKRLIKTPKLYFADHGLVNYLLNIETMDHLTASLFKGALWENFVFCELVKTVSVTPGRDLFFYRDQNGVEVDFVLEKSGKVFLIEAKAQELSHDNKLNFSKVAPLITNKIVESFLACPTNEQSVIAHKDYRIFNPLYCMINL